MSELLIYLWGQNLVRKGKTARGEPLLYQNPDKWGVVNLWLEQWSWNMMEQQLMTNHG